MTAPQTAQPLFTTADPHLCYLSPASTAASDSSFSYPVMPPLQQDPYDVVPQRKKSKSPKATSPGTGGGFTFITATNPKEMKSKKVMTIVRKQAMGHYLENEKKEPKSERSRVNSEASDLSRNSITSIDGAGPSTRPKMSRRGGGKRSQESPSESLRPSTNTNRDSNASMQLVRSQGYIEVVLDAEPLFKPMAPRETRVFDRSDVPMLKSIGKSLDPFRTMFHSSNPHVSSEELKHACSKYFGTVGLGRDWIPTCVERPHSFLSTLYLASVYRDVIHQHEVESLATVALRQDIIAMVGEDFLDLQKRLDDHNIIAISQLIIGGVIAREGASLAYHEKGMEVMIKQRGGLKSLGLQGKIAFATSWVNLTSAILRETSPRPMYHDHLQTRASSSHALAATVPESPLYCPRAKFFTLERSDDCDQKTLELIGDVRTMTRLFLSGADESGRSLTSLYKTITTKYTSVEQLARTNVLRPQDWKYEAIRLTAIVQATAMAKHIPLSAALDQAATSPKQPSSLYTCSTASRSNESIFSTAEAQQVSPLTDCATSPTYNIHDPVTGRPGFPFDSCIVDFDPQRVSVSSQSAMLQRSSLSSTHRSSIVSAARPSLSSIPSTSADMLYFPSAGVRSSTYGSPPSVLQDIRDALEKSNLSYAWKNMAGVLFWIGLVMGAASHRSNKSHLKKYFSATALRVGIMLCFDHPDAVQASVLGMTDMVAKLSGADTTAAKKRRC
ncbi:hypothetical protein ACN47E_002685 [Coniothyrium glycines]